MIELSPQQCEANRISNVQTREKCLVAGSATCPTGQATCRRQLLIRSEVLRLLHLQGYQVQKLIDTRQLTAIRIVGEERFDSRDVDGLIESYKSTAARRGNDQG